MKRKNKNSQTSSANRLIITPVCRNALRCAGTSANLKIVFLLFFTFHISHFTFSQDIHFSQFYFSPLTTNPAQTGFFNGKFRFALNYRDQWSWTKYYKTFSASVDMHALDINNDVLGVGVYFVSDKAIAGKMGTTGTMLSLAYHKDLSGGTNKIAFGLQGGLMQVGFDPNVLVFGDQYENSSNGVAAATTNESFPNTTAQYVDVNAGALWHFIPSEKMNVYLGVSLLHLTTPTLTFLSNDKSDLSTRFVLQGGAAASLGQKMDLLPSFLYMKQGGSKEFYLGTAVRFNFDEGAGVRFGGWYRNVGSDALVVMAGLDYKNFKLGLSYDFNVSSLSQVSKSKGGFEIALIYIISPPKKKGKGGISCPTF